MDLPVEVWTGEVGKCGNLHLCVGKAAMEIFDINRNNETHNIAAASFFTSVFSLWLYEVKCNRTVAWGLRMSALS